MLVGVAHDEADRTARRLSLEHATQDLNLVWFIPRRCDFALAWTPAVELTLYEGYVDIDTSRHSIDHPSDGLTMTLAKGRQPEYIAETIHFSLLIFDFSLLNGNVRSRSRPRDDGDLRSHHTHLRHDGARSRCSRQ